MYLRSPVVLVVLLLACGGSQGTRETRTIPLGQARAAEILSAAAVSYGQTTTNVPARLTNGTLVNIDLLLPEMRAGVVYLNEQDRRDTGVVPQAASGTDLYALLARLEGSQEEVRVLIVQDADLSYIPNPRADQRRPEDTTIAEVEARLRRDALDFFQAVLDLQGGTAAR